jgi:hypothetical protein
MSNSDPSSSNGGELERLNKPASGHLDDDEKQHELNRTIDIEAGRNASLKRGNSSSKNVQFKIFNLIEKIKINFKINK